MVQPLGQNGYERQNQCIEEREENQKRDGMM